MRKIFSIVPAILLSLFVSSCSDSFSLFYESLVFPSFDLQANSALSDIRIVRYPAAKKSQNGKGIVLDESSENNSLLVAPSAPAEVKEEKFPKEMVPADTKEQKAKQELKTNNPENIKVIQDIGGKKTLRVKERIFKKNNEGIVVHEVLPASLRPEYVKGIYLSNNTAQVGELMDRHIADAKNYGINTFVIDVQRKSVPAQLVQKLIDNQIYPVARVVVFEGGLAEATPSPTHIQNILNYIATSAKLGFKEVQLDYIRYADHASLRKLSLDFKYSEIDKILARAQEEAQKHNVLISADLFGRITLNNNDHIGQKLELFGKRMDVIYPMLYPSHYYFDDFRTSHPYETVKEGIANSVLRIGQESKIVGYIQGFHMYVNKSGLSFQEYVRQQIQAVEDGQGDGWIIWNPHNKYDECYAAMLAEAKRKEKLQNMQARH